MDDRPINYDNVDRSPHYSAAWRFPGGGITPTSGVLYPDRDSAESEQRSWQQAHRRQTPDSDVTVVIIRHELAYCLGCATCGERPADLVCRTASWDEMREHVRHYCPGWQITDELTIFCPTHSEET